MASFTGVGDNTELQMTHKGDEVLISISGTYNMTILFQREVVPGSGAWITLDSFSTANATVSQSYYTEYPNEKVRLIVSVDTSGTATATLTDNAEIDFPELDIKDPRGNKMMTFKEGGAVQFYGGVRVGDPVALTASLTLEPQLHAGVPLVFTTAGAVTVTLPAASGTGDEYFISLSITATGNKIIQAASASDVIQGGVVVATDTSGLNVPTATTSDTITMNGSTTGGIVGSYVRLTDVASGVWIVEGFLVSTGVEATPFSAAV